MEGKSSDWVRGPSGPTVCRCCFAEGCYKDISTEYFWMGKREVYAEMLTETFDLSIAFAQSSGPNSNSRLICEPCISRLRDASEFKRQVQECEKMFMEYLDPGRVQEIEMEITPEQMEKEVKLEPVKLEKGASEDEFDDRGGFDDMDDDDLDDQPLTKLASKVPKKESVDFLDLLDNAKAEKRKSTSKAKASPAKKAKAKKETPKATASKAKPEKKKKEINEETSVANGARQNARIILAYCTAYPINYHTTVLECYICQTSFDDPKLFRVHLDTQHTVSERDAKCPAFRKNNVLVDITDLRCRTCTSSFDGLDSLVDHLIARHQLNIDVANSLGLVPLKLEKNRFQCVMCPEVLASMQSLSRHTAMHLYRYTCDACGRKFATLRNLDVHFRSNHQQSTKSNKNDKYFCARCRKSFPTPKAKKEHLKTSKGCQTYVCNLCGERFLYWELKETHQVTVHNKEKTIFRCVECDEVFKYRHYLLRHFKLTHTDKNKCPYCDKKFYTIPQLQEHVAGHTGEKRYVCDVCNARFTCKQGWQRHCVTHDDSKKFACPVCSKLFARRYRIKGHIAKNHPNYLNIAG